MRNELTGKQLIQQAAEGLSALLRGWAEAIFGLPVQRPALGALTWADLIILGCFLAIALLLHGAAAAFLRRKIRQVGEGTGIEELGISRSLGVHRENLVFEDLDLVAVEHRGGVGTQADAVDGDLRVRGHRADRRGALGCPLDDGMVGSYPLALEHDGTPGGGAYDRISSGDGNPSAADFKLHHCVGPSA